MARAADGPEPAIPAAGTGGAYGEWKSARVTDESRPLGKPFRIGARVYYRHTLGADPDGEVHLLLPGLPGAGVRRWMDEEQLDGATKDHAGDVDAAWQRRLSALWERLEPKHAGYWPGTRWPRRYKGMDTRLVAKNPEVTVSGWQADTVSLPQAAPEIVLIAERAFWLDPPQKPGVEQDERDIAESLEHEHVEFADKARRVNERWPYISEADWLRCLDEMEGSAHGYTIGAVDGFYGSDKEKRYLRESYYPMLRLRGFGKLVEQWERTDL